MQRNQCSDLKRVDWIGMFGDRSSTAISFDLIRELPALAGMKIA